MALTLIHVLGGFAEDNSSGGCVQEDEPAGRGTHWLSNGAMERWRLEAGLVTNKLYYNTRQSNSDIITQRPGEDSSEVKLRRRNVQLMKSSEHRYKYTH